VPALFEEVQERSPDFVRAVRHESSQPTNRPDR